MNQLESLQDWFNKLAPRERIMVAVCGVVVVIALIWSLLIKPLYISSADLEDRVTRKQAQLANLQELAAQVKASGNAPTTSLSGSNDSLVVLIDRTTRSSDLAQYLKRNQPDGTAGVRLRFEGAPFDKLVVWLGELKQSYGMSMVTANFDDAGAGRVNCSLVITRGGS
jgi:type II secretory pathway component PulM